MAGRALALRVMVRLVGVTRLAERAVGDELRDDVLEVAVVTRDVRVSQRGVRRLRLDRPVARAAVAPGRMMWFVTRAARDGRLGNQRDFGRMARYALLRGVLCVAEGHSALAWCTLCDGNHDRHLLVPRRPRPMTAAAIVLRGRLVMA